MTKNKTTTETNDERDELLGEVVEDYLGQLADGRQPEIESYARAHPQIAALIRQTFPALKMMRESLAEAPRGHGVDLTVSRQLGDFRLLHELGAGGMGFVYEAEQLSMGRHVALKILPMAGALQEKSLQRFRNEVRAASMLDHPNIVSIYSIGEDRGVHYYAMQLIRGQSLAQVIAQLSGLPGDVRSLTGNSIRQVLSSDSRSPTAASELPTEDYEWKADVDQNQDSQETRVERISNVNTLQSTQSSSEFYRSVARLGTQAADALQHAHDQGVLHRDIKPGNLMLDATTKLYITDFGLARIEADAGMTMTGDLVGTLRYMSPEQALGKRVVIDHRSDIYSLGATLYELLALRPSLVGTNRQELLRKIAFEDPPKLRQINHSIPAELETIVSKAIEKGREDRYATAGELADDLRAFLEDRPIKAKPPTLRLRATKWCTRNPVLTWSAVLLLFLLTAGSSLATALIWSEQDRTVKALKRSEQNFQFAESARSKEKLARAEAEKQEQLAKVAASDARDAAQRTSREVVKLLIATGNRHLDDGDLTASLPWFAEALRKDAGTRREKLHRIRLATVLRQCPKPSLMVRSTYNRPANRWSPDGKLVIVVNDRSVDLWNVQSQQLVLTLALDALGTNASFSPDGKRIVVATRAGKLQVWDSTDGQPVTAAFKVGPGLHSAAFSADGQQILSLTVPPDTDHFEACVWDAATGKPTTTPMKHVSRANTYPHASLSADGRWVLTTSSATAIANIWDADTGELHQRIPTQHYGGILHSVFAPRESHFLTTGKNGTGRIWDAATGHPITPPLLHGKTKGHSGSNWIRHGDFSKDGRYVATADPASGSIRISESVTGDVVTPLLKHGSGIRRIGFSPDGRWIAAGTESGEVIIWDIESGKRVEPPLNHQGRIERFSFDPHGRYVLVIAAHLTTVWDLATGHSGRHVAYMNSPPTYPSYTHDGVTVLTTHQYSWAQVQIWDPVSRRPLSQLLGHDIASSLDGQVCITASDDGVARVWNLREGMEGRKGLQHEAAVLKVSISHDGRCAATVTTNGRCRIWDLTSNQPLIRELSTGATIVFASINDDGSLVAILDDAGQIKVYETKSGKLLRDKMFHTSAYILTFFHGGNRLHSGSRSDVRVWEWRSGKTISSNRRLGTYRRSATLSHDEKRTVTGHNDGAVHVWETTSGQLLAPVIQNPTRVDNVCFSPDDRMLLTVGMEGDTGGARLWDAETGQAIGPWMKPAHRGAIKERSMIDPAGSSFSPDGQRIVTGYWGHVTQWDVSPDMRPIADLVTLAEIHSALRFDEQGNLARMESDQAFKLAESIRARYPDGFRASSEQVAGWHEELAKRYSDSTDSLRHHHAVIAHEPDVWWHYLQRAQTYWKLNRWEEAISDYKTTVEKAPEIGNSHAYLSYAFQTCPDETMRDTKQALTEALAATELAPQDQFAWSQLSRASVINRDYPQALQAAHRVIELCGSHTPDDSAFRQRAEVYLAVGQFDNAIADFSKAVDVSPEQSAAYYRAALAELVFNDQNAYRNACSKMLERFSGDTIDKIHWVAWTCALAPDAVDDLPNTVNQLEEILSNSTDSQYLSALGALLHRAGRYEDAIIRLNQAVETRSDEHSISTSSTYTWFFLAMAEQRLGNFDAAEKWMEKAEHQAKQELTDESIAWNRKATIELLREEATALVARDVATEN